MALYLSSHLALSRVSAGMVRHDWGVSQGFFYLPLRPDLLAAHEASLLPVHYAPTDFFWPAWSLDHAVLGGPMPILHYQPIKPLSSS